MLLFQTRVSAVFITFVGY